jgi:hypothetical protein
MFLLYYFSHNIKNKEIFGANLERNLAAKIFFISKFFYIYSYNLQLRSLKYGAWQFSSLANKAIPFKLYP